MIRCRKHSVPTRSGATTPITPRTNHARKVHIHSNHMIVRTIVGVDSSELTVVLVVIVVSLRRCFRLFVRTMTVSTFEVRESNGFRISTLRRQRSDSCLVPSASAVVIW